MTAMIYIGVAALLFGAGLYFGRLWGRNKTNESLVDQLREREQIMVGYVAHIQNLEARNEKLRQRVSDTFANHPNVDSVVSLWDEIRGVSEDTDTTED